MAAFISAPCVNKDGNKGPCSIVVKNCCWTSVGEYCVDADLELDLRASKLRLDPGLRASWEGLETMVWYWSFEAVSASD